MADIDVIDDPVLKAISLDTYVVKQDMITFETGEIAATADNINIEEHDGIDNAVLKTIFPDISLTFASQEEQTSSYKNPYTTKSNEKLLKSPKQEVPDSIDRDDIDVSVLHEEVDLGISVIDDEGDYKVPGLVDSVPTGSASGSRVNSSLNDSSCSGASPLLEVRRPMADIDVIEDPVLKAISLVTPVVKHEMMTFETGEASPPNPNKKLKEFEEIHLTNAKGSSNRINYKSPSRISESMRDPVVKLTPLVVTNSITKRKQFVCDKCTLKFASVDSLIRHTQKFCKQSHNILSVLKCKRDVKLKIYKQNNLSNRARTHTGKKPYACDLCEFKCSQKANLKRHLRTHTGAKLYACTFCAFKSNKKINLKIHLNSHIGEKLYACDFCAYKFNAKSHLERHIRSHTGEKPYACDFCEFKCTLNFNLQSHKRIHTGEKHYACDFCELKFYNYTQLKIHARTHTGEKPYACDFCEFKCNQKVNLKTHLRTHTGEKPYACDFCEFRCSHNVNLKTHLRTHTGEKPYACDFCEFRCSHNVNLKKHLRTHTGEKPYACDFCEFKCIQKINLQRHVRSHTRENDCLDYKM